MYDPQAFQIEMTRMTFWLIVGQAIGAALFFAGLYFAIKAAVRDGINESKLGNRDLRPSSRGPSEPEAWEHHMEAVKVREAAKTMPPFRAD